MLINFFLWIVTAFAMFNAFFSLMYIITNIVMRSKSNVPQRLKRNPRAPNKLQRAPKREIGILRSIFQIAHNNF